MTCIAAPDDVRAEWATDHGLDGVTGDAWADDVAAIESRARRRRGHAHPAEGRDHPPRRPGARLGGGPDPAQRRRLRRLRQLPVRLPARDEAVGHPRPSRRARPRRAPGSCRTRGSTRVLSRAAGRSASRRTVRRRRHRLVASSVRAPTVVLAAGALRTPGRSCRRPASSTRTSADTCGSTRCRSSPAASPSRSRCGAARCRRRARSSSRRRSPAGTATSSSPRRATRASLALALPWEGADGARRRHGAASATCRR